MEKLNLTLPNVSQIKESEIISTWGKEADVSDFAVLQGASLNRSRGTGDYWLKDIYDYSHNYSNGINCDGIFTKYSIYSTHAGIRPVTSYSSIKKYFLKEFKGKNNITEGEFGLFPQYAPSKELQEEIIGRIEHNELTKSLLKVPINSTLNKLERLNSYKYNGKIYTLCTANLYNGKYDEYLATNGVIYHTGDKVVTEMSPIKTLNSEKENLTIFENIIMSGISYNNTRSCSKAFSKTHLYYYIYKYLAPFIMQSIEFINENDEDENKLQQNVKRLMK